MYSDGREKDKGWGTSGTYGKDKKWVQNFVIKPDEENSNIQRTQEAASLGTARQRSYNEYHTHLLPRLIISRLYVHVHAHLQGVIFRHPEC
jgi:hypothetical protein